MRFAAAIFPVMFFFMKIPAHSTVPFLAQYSRGLGLPLDLKDPSPGESCVQYLRVGDGGGVDSRSPPSPSQPIMSDGSSPPAMGGEGRGHNGHTRVEK